MEILQTVSDNGKAAVLGCDSPIEGENANELKRTADELVAKGVTTVVLDLTRVGHVASNGLSILGNLNKKMKSVQGQMILAGMNREILSIFGLLGFSRDCVCAPSLEVAYGMAAKFSGGALPQTGAEPAAVVKSEPAAAETPSRNAAKDPSADIPGEPAVQEGETLFSRPLIVECEECSSFVRVHSSGQFMCPSCHVEFHVERDGTVIF